MCKMGSAQQAHHLLCGSEANREGNKNEKKRTKMFPVASTPANGLKGFLCAAGVGAGPTKEKTTKIDHRFQFQWPREK